MDLAWRPLLHRAQLMEKVAEVDDAVLAAYLEKEDVPALLKTGCAPGHHEPQSGARALRRSFTNKGTQPA